LLDSEYENSIASHEIGATNLTPAAHSSDLLLLDILNRILDKGIVINGDVTLAIAGTDLLSLKINLVIASLETAKRYGIELPWEKWKREQQEPNDSNISVSHNEAISLVPDSPDRADNGNGRRKGLEHLQRASGRKKNSHSTPSLIAETLAARDRKVRKGSVGA